MWFNSENKFNTKFNRPSPVELVIVQKPTKFPHISTLLVLLFKTSCLSITVISCDPHQMCNPFWWRNILILFVQCIFLQSCREFEFGLLNSKSYDLNLISSIEFNCTHDFTFSLWEKLVYFFYKINNKFCQSKTPLEEHISNRFSKYLTTKNCRPHLLKKFNQVILC